MSGEIPSFLGDIFIRLELQNNEFVGCFPEELKAICHLDVNFSSNPALPWQGDFEQFCNSSSQIGAPCEDGLSYTINYIDNNCDCIAILTSLSEIQDTSLKVFPNPIINELFIEAINSPDNWEFILLTMEGRNIGRFNTNRYDVSGLKPGIYLLIAENKGTGKRSLIKIAKQ